jgi:hypothetical protein
MTIISSVKKFLIGGFCLLIGLSANTQLQPWQNVLYLHYKGGHPTFPAAAYRNISVAEFRSMVRRSFQASGFSFVSAEEQKDKSTIFRFNLAADPQTGPSAKISASTDELLDGKKRCAPCFLRFTEINNAAEIGTLPWMAQYDLTALVMQGIDKAYSNIEASGREHLDSSFGFNYKPQWKGERNLLGNSYTGIGLPDLKERIVNAYRNAGFTPIEGKSNSKTGLELTFSFPLDPTKDGGGAIYELGIAGQYDTNGHCYPCEVIEAYNPYQRLPPAGLSGVLNRATLESRFSAARSTAFENMRIDLERYLRPRSGFSIPDKPAPLGSPLPPAIKLPVVVT